MRKRNSKKKSSSSMYRSGLEKEFAENFAGLGFEYEPYSVKYTMHRLYKPDFVIGNYLIECKGFFRVGDVYFDEDTVQYMEANLGIRS